MVKMMSPEVKTPLIHRKINKTIVNDKSIEALTRETDKNVTGTFINIECPGQTAKVCCKYYKDMPYFEKVFMDQERATIPLSVARHINERCQYDEHAYIQDEKGNALKTGNKKPRYKFMIEMAA
jgi:hypothetical protein